MKLLLHTCCAPCAIHPVREARRDNFTVTGFFCNPNIHPHSEYIKRKREAESFFKSEGMKMVWPEYEPGRFFGSVTGSASSPGRCSICWDIRLGESVSLAKEEGFDAFTTTLLGSPYQDHAILKSICENLSKKSGVNFYYKDFRIGFKDAHKLAREKGIYCQNYCGCVFSMVEREERRKKPIPLRKWDGL